MQGSVMGKEVGKGTMSVAVAGSGVVVMVAERERKVASKVVRCILKMVSKVGGRLNWR